MRRFPLASLGLSAALALCACANSLDARIAREVAEQNVLDEYNGSVPPEDRLQCFRRIPVGSSIKKKICMTAAQLERERAKGRSFVNAGRNVPQPTQGNRGSSR